MLQIFSKRQIVGVIAQSKVRRYLKLFAPICLAVGNPLFSATILVTNNDDLYQTPGSLGDALYNAVDGDVIDCSPIAGQTISMGFHPLPAIGINFTSPASSLTILGHGVIIDAGNAVTLFSLAQGTARISDFTLQNGLSIGGIGGFGMNGGGGGTGGGGALYVHSGTAMTISGMSLNNNQAIGGAGGAGSSGGSGGGGGGFGGGSGGFASIAGPTAGSAGGGGGNSGGTSGGRDGGVGSPNTFSNFGGAGGGGARPNASPPPMGAKAGGSSAASAFGPAHTGGAGGTSTAVNAGGGGGGAGSGGNGMPGSNATITPAAGGNGGTGGVGIGANSTYGVGGGGGGGNSGGAGYGASGGGGGLAGPGGDGGLLGGGGGGSAGVGGNGGFGAGGGGGQIGGVDIYGVGGAGGSAIGLPAGGGGGSGLGGAIFIQEDALLIIEDGMSFSGNSTTAGLGGTAVGSKGENGASLGQDIFIQAGGTLTFQIDQTLTLSNPIEGAGLSTQASNPGLVKSGSGTLGLIGANTYLGDTVVQAGTLNLNGSVSGNVRTDTGGTLSGNATVQGTINNNGTLSPGNSIGEIFADALNLSSTSVYTVEVNPTSATLLSVSGAAVIGGTLEVTQDPGSYNTSGQYLILQAADGVTGAFDSIVINSLPGFTFTLEKTDTTLSLVYNLIPSSPTNVRGRQIKNQFLTQTDIINILTWDASTGSGPKTVAYQVYRGNQLIGTVSASSPLNFRDHNRLKNVAYTYCIVSVDTDGNTASPVCITIAPQ